VDSRQEESNVEPHRPYQHDYVLSQQDPMLKPALPGWAQVFRTTLLVLAGILSLILLLLLTMGTSTVGDLYQDSTVSFLQSLVYVALALPALGIPYVIASIVYGALWINTLRGRGYRSYPATSWLLVAGPLVVGLAILALAALIIVPARLL
jgi:hypothetical protein